MIGDSFSQVGAFVRDRIALLDVDGSVDATLNPNANDTVCALAGQRRNFIAGLSTPQAAVQSLTPVGYSSGGSLVTRMRSGDRPELALRRFQSADQPHLLPARTRPSRLRYLHRIGLPDRKRTPVPSRRQRRHFLQRLRPAVGAFFCEIRFGRIVHARWSQQACPSVPIDRNGVTRNSHYPIKRLPCHVMLARLHQCC